METGVRGDLSEWVALADRRRPRRILDVGTGGGRIGAALARADPGRTVVGVDITMALLVRRPPIRIVLGDVRAVPFVRASFDLAVVANDPLAHVLGDSDRASAVAELRRVLDPRGLAVIDGVWMTPEDRAAATVALVRERSLGQLAVRESWRALGGDVYDAVYEYARTGSAPVRAAARLRAWRLDEPALRGARIVGDLAGSPFDPARPRIVIILGPE